MAFITRKSSADTLVVWIPSRSLTVFPCTSPPITIRWTPRSARKIGADSAIAVGGADSVRLVVLNAKNVIDAVWTVRWKDTGAGSSSSAAGKVLHRPSPHRQVPYKVLLPRRLFRPRPLVSSSSAKTAAESSSSAASSSAVAVSSSAKSSAKSISVLQLTVNGSNLVNAGFRAKNFVTLSSRNALDSVQVKRLTVSAGATCDLPTATNLLFTDPLESGIATYSFKITVEDGSSDTWSIEATYPLGANPDLAFTGGTVTVTGNKVYVEVPYGTDIPRLRLRRSIRRMTCGTGKRSISWMRRARSAMYTVKAGYQLPGSDFSARDNSFWATTSDAMATEGKSTVALITHYKFTSSASLTENGSSITFIHERSRLRLGNDRRREIPGGWKMATGAYFAGNLSGTDAKT